MKSLAIASHVALVNGQEYDGIGNVLIEALSTIPTEYYMVHHSMDGGLSSFVRKYGKKGVLSETKLFVLSRPGPLRYATELLATVAYFTFYKKVDVYVGIDPLNALAAVILRKLGRVQHCVFYTPDYSTTRFENKLMNNVYHAIDRFCVRHADEVWSVSPKIAEVRKKIGLADDKNILVPNVPPAKFDYLRSNTRERHTLIIYGILDKQLDYEGSIRAVGRLSGAYSDIKLVIVGNGPEEEKLKSITKELRLEDRVEFKGRHPLSETLEYASHAGVGLALYTGKWAFNYYGDSTKCREYFFFGLPVVSTDTHATVPEIVEAKAGIIVKKNVDNYVSALKEIFENYKNFADSSRILGGKYSDIHKKQLLRLLKA